MSRAVSLLTLRARVRELADIPGDSTTGRYPTTRINALINNSWQRMREIACEAGNGLIYLKATTPTTMTPGVVDSSSMHGTLPWPSDAVSIHGIDVVFASNDIRQLQPVSWGERGQFHDVYGGMTGLPMCFTPINIGVESGVSVTAGTIAIFPAPDRAYTYKIYYLPSWVDKTADTDVFDGIAGHEEWPCLDAAVKIVLADGDPSRTANFLMGERTKAEELLTRRANRLQRVGPTQRRNVRAENRRDRILNWRRPV